MASSLLCALLASHIAPSYLIGSSPSSLTSHIDSTPHFTHLLTFRPLLFCLLTSSHLSPVAIFVARTNLLGRFEPGPPTKPLQYRATTSTSPPKSRSLSPSFIYLTVVRLTVPCLTLSPLLPLTPSTPTHFRYRFTFTLYLPVYLLLHLFFCYGIYADVEVSRRGSH